MRAIIVLAFIGHTMATQAEVKRMVEQLLMMQEARQMPPSPRMVPIAPTSRTPINNLSGMSEADREEYNKLMRKVPVDPPPEAQPYQPRQPPPPEQRQFWQRNPWDY
jgi:hypothetical protein